MNTEYEKLMEKKNLKSCNRNKATTFLYPAGIYLLKVNKRNIEQDVKYVQKLTNAWRRSGVLIIDFEHILALSR